MLLLIWHSCQVPVKSLQVSICLLPHRQEMLPVLLKFFNFLIRYFGFALDISLQGFGFELGFVCLF